MKNLLILILILPIFLGGENSNIINSSPFGIVAVWYDECEDRDIKAKRKWREKYMPKIEYTKACGLSWIRPNCIPHRNSLHPEKNNFFYFAPIDSFVKFMQEKGMNILYIGWPRNHYKEFKDDSIGYYEFYRNLVERYDGDGEGYTVPNEWGGIYYPEPDWLIKPIKYWEICNEPYAQPPKGWPDYRNRTLNDFRIYLRAASRGVHDADSTAKVIAPAMKPLQNTWKTKSDLIKLSPYSLWLWILGDSMKDYIDIISVHLYERDISLLFNELDSLKIILDSLNADKIEIWVTETGWHTDNYQGGITEEGQAKNYIKYCDNMLKRKWLGKTFFFALKFVGNKYPKEWGLVWSDFRKKQSFDSLKNYIKRFKLN